MLENKFIRIILILLLGIIIPASTFLLFPQSVTDIGAYLSADFLIKAVLGILGLGVYFYICIISAYKFPIFPLFILFFYQIMQYLLNEFLPITFNYRTFALLFVIPVMFITFQREKIKKFLFPFLGVFLFYTLNLFYTFLNYTHAPNFIYNINMYFHKPDSILPPSYAIEMLIFLSLLLMGIYLSANLVRNNNKKINYQISIFLTWFFIIASLVSIIAYFTSTIHFVEVVGGIRRLKGIASNSNILGFLNVCISLYLVRFLYFSKNIFEKNLIKLALVLIFIATIFTFSRTNITFLILLHMFNYVILSKNRVETAFKVVFLSAFLLAAFFAVDMVFSLGVVDKIQVRLSDEQSNMFRPMVIEYLFSQQGFDATILIGHGIAGSSSTLFNLFSTQYYITTLPIVYHPHNSYVHLFFDYGLLGLFTYISTVFYIGLSALKKAVASNFLDINSIILTELVGFAMIASLVDGYLLNFELVPFWIILTIMYINTLIVSRGNNAKV